MITDTAFWPSGPVRISWHDSTESELPITGAHGFCFRDGCVLVCDICGRGPTIPGGHIDAGESPEECLVREASEEACVRLCGLKFLGFIEADHSQNDVYEGPYPIRSVQAIYRAEIESIDDFSAEHEAVSRLLIETSALPSVHHEWNAVLQAAFNSAFPNGS